MLSGDVSDTLLVVLGAVLAELLAAMSTRKVNKEMKRTFGPHEETLLHYAAKEGWVANSIEIT